MAFYYSTRNHQYRFVGHTSSTYLSANESPGLYLESLRSRVLHLCIDLYETEDPAPKLLATVRPTSLG